MFKQRFKLCVECLKLTQSIDTASLFQLQLKIARNLQGFSRGGSHIQMRTFVKYESLDKVLAG